MIQMHSLSRFVLPSLLGLLLAVPAAAQEKDKLQGFDSRKKANREKLLKDLGGTEETEQAVANGLQWLARHQVGDTGAWQLDGKFPDKGNKNDTAGTAFGLLPFLGAGFTHQTDKTNPHDQVVEKGLGVLLQVQDQEKGSFNRDSYANALAALAVIEAYGMTGDPKLKEPAQRGVDFIASAQHVNGGWRYSPGQAGDTSVTAWCVQVLVAARRAGLKVDAGTLKKASRYFDSVCDEGKTEGYGYVEPHPTPTMTAAALVSREGLTSWGPQNLRLVKAVDNFIKPNYPGLKKDVYYYYYAHHAARMSGGETWDVWNKKMRTVLVKTQDKDKARPETFGSWSPVGDQWGGTGGRLMVTAMNLMMLEEYYRHPALKQD